MAEQRVWEEIFMPGSHEEPLWELFHENSKVSRYTQTPSKEEVRSRMRKFHESLPFEGYPRVDLSHSFAPLSLPLEQAITTRTSARNFSPRELTLEHIATLFFYAYGVTRKNTDTPFPRPFRVVPSGGALYPLELFFHTASLKGHSSGIYHYNPSEHCLRHLQEGDNTHRISLGLVQPELAQGTSLIIFLTALFERSTFKYGERGYRYILLEAGHVAQNLNLVANALGLGCVNIGGYFDREIDEYLDLDGITHSTIYTIAIGGKTDASENTSKKDGIPTHPHASERSGSNAIEAE
ncbi:SagB/ThcOx family dehydrogenase [Nitrospira sp. MA-1]|nr:SagB/ThcOx family dehydrogenase [Nitrospira sp. MA-1]